MQHFWCLGCGCWLVPSGGAAFQHFLSEGQDFSELGLGPGGIEDLFLAGFVTFGTVFLGWQSPWQRLVKRMTRFFTKLDADGSYRALKEVCEKMGYGWKMSCTNQVRVRAWNWGWDPCAGSSGNNLRRTHKPPPCFAGHHLDHRQEEQQTHLQGEPGGDGEQDLGGFSPLQGVQGVRVGGGGCTAGAGWGRTHVKWVQDGAGWE